MDVSKYGLEPEPTVIEGLQAGCDVVAFSGDKLLGGPQAGILCGRAELIAQLKRHPLARAVRSDKMCLAGLAATLNHYLTDQAISEIPVWRMISQPLEAVAEKAEVWSTRLQEQGIEASVVDGYSMVGGGSLPGTRLPTKLVAVRKPNVGELAALLRSRRTPVIGRIQDDLYLTDPRTVLPEEEDRFLQALLECGTM